MLYFVLNDHDAFSDSRILLLVQQHKMDDGLDRRRRQIGSLPSKKAKNSVVQFLGMRLKYLLPKSVRSPPPGVPAMIPLNRRLK
jgi:hypothetical protein